MPTYEYRCPMCKDEWDFNHAFDEDPVVFCPACEVGMERVICSPYFLRTPIETRYNPAVGKGIRTKRQLADELKYASDERTLKTGIVHDYQPVDLRDKEALGVTDEGLDATRAQEVVSGKREVRKWL